MRRLNYRNLSNSLKTHKLKLNLTSFDDDLFSQKQSEQPSKTKARACSAKQSRSTTSIAKTKSTKHFRQFTSSQVENLGDTVLEIRPKTATNRFYRSSKADQRQKIKNDIFYELEISFIEHLSFLSKEERLQIREELIEIYRLINVKQKDFCSVVQKLQKLQNQLSKVLEHRATHLYFYLVFWKFLSVENTEKNRYEKQVKILILAEYHARVFKLRKLTLLICMEIQQKLLKINKFEESREYGIKCLKLSVILQDRYFELKMLQYLGLLHIYQGTLNVQGNNILTQKQRNRIIKMYKEKDQIPRIFEFLKTDTKSQQNCNSLSIFDMKECFFTEGKNYIAAEVPSNNIKRFNKNFQAITKGLNKNSKIRSKMENINRVGEVKKYLSKDNFITLHPQSNAVKENFQSQVILTHTKYGEIEKHKNFMSKEFPVIVSQLHFIIKAKIPQLNR